MCVAAHLSEGRDDVERAVAVAVAVLLQRQEGLGVVHRQQRLEEPGSQLMLLAAAVGMAIIPSGGSGNSVVASWYFVVK